MKLFVGVKGFVEHEGKILILREQQYDEGTNEGKWDVPGGRIESKEPLFDGLKREVKEESGLSVEPGKAFHVAENFPAIKEEKCHIIRIYITCIIAGSPEVVISQDHDQFAWIDPQRHIDYILIDSPTDNVHDAFIEYTSLRKT